jgi:hypothetical protein
MNTKQILLLIALVAGVGITGLVMHRKQGEAWTGGAAEGQKLLANLPVGEALAQMAIQQGTNTLTLMKRDDVWRVQERGGYPANYGEISSAILKLRDVKPVQTEQIGASQLGRLELLPPGAGSNTATRVEFRDAAGKVLSSLLLGKTQMREDSRAAQFGGGDMGGGGFPAGRWVMLGDVKDKVLLVSDPLSSLVPNAGQWLNKDFIKVDKIKSITVTHLEATNSWSVTRTNDSGAEWSLADAKPGEALDSTKTGGFDYALASPSFNDVVVDAKPAELGLDKPTTIAIETFDGFSYLLKAGTKTDDNQPLVVSINASLPKERVPVADEKPEDKARFDKEFADRQKVLGEKLATEKKFESWTYLVSGWTLDALLKNRGELLAMKQSEEPKAEMNPDEVPASAPLK